MTTILLALAALACLYGLICTALYVHLKRASEVEQHDREAYKAWGGGPAS